MISDLMYREKDSFDELTELENIVAQDLKYIPIISTEVERWFSSYRTWIFVCVSADELAP